VFDVDKQIIIRTARCTIILYEKELFQLLATKPDLFEKAIGRGKGLKRCIATEKRMTGQSGESPWDQCE